MIKIVKTNIEDVFLIQPQIHHDDRGYFFESYNEKELSDKGMNIDFIQDNESKSSFGVLRGIHFQKPPFEQSKLVRVIQGRIQDVAVDLRPSSKTYKSYVSVVLDDKNKNQIFIPKGFGHGFLTLSETAIISYKVDCHYNKKFDRTGVKYNDPKLKIKWNLEDKQILVSNKDQNLPFI